MALTLDIKTVIVELNNGTQAKIFDQTGDYDAVNNPTGWGNGTTNPSRDAITKITITIDKGDISYSEEFTDAGDIEDFLDPTIGLVFNSSDVLGSAYDIFEDGVYTFQTKIEGTWSGSPSPYEVYDEHFEFFLWNMWADIRKLTTTLQVPITNYLESYNISLLNCLFDDILFNCQFGQRTKAEEIYTFLRNVLDNNTVLTELFKNFKTYA